MHTTETVIMTESSDDNINISQQHPVNLTAYTDNDKDNPNSLLNGSIIVISSISITSCLVSLWIVSKCQKMPVPIKYLSKNFITSFMVIDLSISLHSVAMFFWGYEHYDLIFDSRIFFASLFTAVLWCSLATLTYERLLALVQPFMYKKYTTKPKLVVLICAIWIVNILVSTIIFLASTTNHCHMGNFYCFHENLYKIFQPFKQCCLSLLTLYGLFIVIAYAKILLIILKHQRRIAATVSEQDLGVTPGMKLTSTKTIAAIISAFIVFQLPMVIHLVIFEIQPSLKHQTWRMILQGMDYIGYQLNVYASLYLYIWKFKECKMHFYLLFSKFSRRFEQVASEMRFDVFNIVVYDKNSTNKSQTTDCLV